MYSTLGCAFTPMSETVDSGLGGTGHEKPNAHDGVSEMAMHGIYSKGGWKNSMKMRWGGRLESSELVEPES